MPSPDPITVPVDVDLGTISGPVLAEADKPQVFEVHGYQNIADGGVRDLSVLALPPGWTQHTTHLEQFRLSPDRAKGTLTVADPGSFITAVTARHEGGAPVRFEICEPAATVTAILNPIHQDGAGWEDHKVQLHIQPTPEWQAWVNGQGLHSQEEFAEFVEDHLDEIQEPDPATMLELAQTFQANLTARFSRAMVLQSGRIQLTYDENEEVSAGRAGQIEIPTEFTIAVRPAVGIDRIGIRARLRYRAERGTLRLGWKLIGVDLVNRRILGDTRDLIEEAFPGSPIINVVR